MSAHVHHQHVLGFERPQLPGAAPPVAYEFFPLTVDVFAVDMLGRETEALLDFPMLPRCEETSPSLTPTAASRKAEGAGGMWHLAGQPCQLSEAELQLPFFHLPNWTLSLRSPPLNPATTTITNPPTLAPRISYRLQPASPVTPCGSRAPAAPGNQIPGCSHPSGSRSHRQTLAPASPPSPGPLAHPASPTGDPRAREAR